MCRKNYIGIVKKRNLRGSQDRGRCWAEAEAGYLILDIQSYFFDAKMTWLGQQEEKGMDK
jgi:hypothetical protein